MLRDEPLLIVALVSTATVEEARLIHDTLPTASAAFGRVISGALLLSSLLKEPERVILQVVGDGPLKGILAEADWLSRVRGYVKRPHIHLGLRDDKLDVGRAIGKGFLHVIKDLGLKEPYQGSVPIQTGEIALDLAYYLRVSEQIPSAVSLGVYVDTDNSVKASGGFMVQALPDLNEKTITYLEQRMGSVRPVSSMVLDGLGPEEIMEEAVGLPFVIVEKRDISYFCPCTKERVLDAIVSLGKGDIEDFSRKGETVNVRCRFCNAEYHISTEELLSLLKIVGSDE